jgi:tRNA threonylcarbamoyl adenosine modification protein YjeE
VTISRLLPAEADTIRLGEDIALALKAGDAVLLSGDLGAGKSSLARAIIRTLAGDYRLEIPSPTFTLVQAYETRLPVRHFDLYRLQSPDELDELGLDEALAEGVILVEWPERAVGRLPSRAIIIRLAEKDRGREVFIEGSGPVHDRIARSLAARDFLAEHGWSEARRTPLAGDASARAYETVNLAGHPRRLLMNSPPLVLGPPVRDGKPYAVIAHSAQTVAAFAAIDKALLDAGICVPRIDAADLDRGFLIIEHLGDGAFLDAAGRPVPARYEAAARLLSEIHAERWPDTMETGYGPVHHLPPFDRDAMLIEAELLIDWYVPYITGAPATPALRADYLRLWNDALDRIAGTEYSLLLRDYHSPNLIWREGRDGHDKLGVLDFQDAMRGPTAYDVASLAMDARVDVPEPVTNATYDAYVDARRRRPGFDEAEFSLAFATMAAQRNSKILGIFVRLDRRDGKPQYLKLLPRIRAYLDRATRHPGLADLRRLYKEHGFLEETAA